MKTVEETRRELFEKWYRIEFPALELRAQNLIGTYTKYHADLSWQAFRAALDAVVIVLPEYTDEVRQYGYAAADVHSAIESTDLGIKVK